MMYRQGVVASSQSQIKQQQNVANGRHAQKQNKEQQNEQQQQPPSPSQKSNEQNRDRRQKSIETQNAKGNYAGAYIDIIKR